MSRVCLLLAFLLNTSVGVLAVEAFSRQDFPTGFVFGAGTSANQVEGAANEDGRTPSIWDSSFAPSGGITPIAPDQYYKYKEDVQLMADTGIDAYRFSISWSRLIPNGRGPVNPKGIQPHVTLHHNDLPLALEDEYGGWVNHRIVKDFTAYADVCFREFGDRVLYWSTVNEANMFSTGGYDMGAMAPFRCSPPFGIKNCSRGNSSTEPYMVAHNILLAHASTAKLYRLKYQNKQHGLIGFIIFTYAIERVTESKEEDFVIQRVNDFNFGWLLHPLVFGDYPVIMKRNAGSRIPTFTNYQSELVKGSFDFIGILHYSYSNVKDNPDSLTMQLRDFYADMAATVNCQGLTLNSDSALDDIPRIDYLREHIGALLEALRNGSNTRGYFVWSFIDLLELFRKPNKFSFGLYHVDLDDPDLKRYPKKSALWYSNFLKGGNITALDVVPKLSSV